MHGAVDPEANPAPGNSSNKMGSMSFARDQREPSPVLVPPVKWSGHSTITVNKKNHCL